MVKDSAMVGNGNLNLEDTGALLGDVKVDIGGSFVVRRGGVVTGVITLSSESPCKIVNKKVVKGSVIILSANRVIIGNANGGGIVNSDITINKLRFYILQKMNQDPSDKILNNMVAFIEQHGREEVERIKKSMGDEFTIEKNAYVDEEKNKIS